MNADTVRIEPFTIAVPQAEIVDLRERLARTRWPDTIGEPWSNGTDLAYLRELVAYWQNDFDWRAQEARLNRFPQYRATFDEIAIHFIHVRSATPGAFPLIITHGWPGSIVEMTEIIPRLTDPAAFGGDAADAFDVVVPSLPGYGFSSAPRKPGMNPPAIADLWTRLMTSLGYSRFGAQGGDWGAAVSTELGIRHPDHVAGVHLNFMMTAYLQGFDDVDLDADERAYFANVQRWTADEGGYAHVHGTKPQSLAYALNDSPAGLAGWIVEKLRTWSDCGGDVERAFTKDEMLTNIAVYWFTQTIGSSIRLYRERTLQPLQRPAQPPPVPFGYAKFPVELSRPPRRLLERVFSISRYTEMPHGGHFAAWEQPDLLASEICALFRPLR